MPANYPRTENRKYRRGQRKITESNEQKLNRIAKTIGGSNKYQCKSKESAESLASALNSQYSSIPGTQIGHYAAISNPPRVVYVENPDPESTTEMVNGFKITTYKNFCTDGWEKDLKEQPFRYTINKNGEHEFDNLRDFKLARDIAVKYNYKILDQMTHSRNYSKNPHDLLPQEIQEIDSYKTAHMHDTETGKNTKLNLRYKNFAFMQRKVSGNNIPNYDSFKKRPDLRREKQADIITQYKQFTENHERAIEASFKSKLKLDFQSYCKDPVKNMDVFSDRSVVDAFEKGHKGIGVKSKYLDGVVFVDKGSEDMGDCCMAYDKLTKKILMRDDVDSDFIENGGLYQELFRAKFYQEHNKEIKLFEKQINSSNDSKLESIAKSFEEVAVDTMTYSFMDGDPKFVKHIYEKYKLAQDPKTISNQIDKFITEKDSKNNYVCDDIKIAEMMTNFYHMDKPTFDIFEQRLNERQNEIGSGRFNEIHDFFNIMKYDCVPEGNLISGMNTAFNWINQGILIEPYQKGMQLERGLNLYGSHSTAIINEELGDGLKLQYHHHRNGAGAIEIYPSAQPTIIGINKDGKPIIDKHNQIILDDNRGEFND
ncbi:MAG: hypothetical protein U9R34_00140 [Nanoarchaeota archaeon]|nr:hypothetical protein [Nanoarchaeota archaeon]